MMDLLFILVMLLVFYLAFCIVGKRPIIPTKKALERAKDKKRMAYQEKTAEMHGEMMEEYDPLFFDNFYEEIVDLREGILIQTEDWYTAIVEVTPVNYYLKDDDEQELIDAITETWFANLDKILPRIIYQNRFIDITDNIEKIRNTSNKLTNLPEKAKELAADLLMTLEDFQKRNPRYDLKMYLAFDYQYKPSSLHTEDPDEDESERAFKKARNELDRHIKRAKHLEKSGVKITRLNNNEVTSLGYHTFQRRRARHLRFQNIEDSEMLAMYVTADQTVEQIVRVKEEIDKFAKEQPNVVDDNVILQKEEN